MDDRQQYDDHHQEYMNGEYESETERDMLGHDMLDKEPDGSSKDELKSDLQLSVRLALQYGVSTIDVDMWVQEAIGEYFDFLQDKQAMCQHHD